METEDSHSKMNREVLRSRTRVSRRRALMLGGTVGLGGVLAACATDQRSTPATASTGAATAAPTTAAALLDTAPRCVATTEETQGPHWFDVDSIRADIREDRPGVPFQLAIRVQNLKACAADGSGASAVGNAVVELWHCDAGGVYSGFETGSNSANAGGPGGRPPGPPPGGGPGGPGGPDGMPPNGPPGDDPMANPSGEKSDGSYSFGDSESKTTDDGTYLRGAQVTDANGIVNFTTIFPGWYVGRTTHIHLKVHVDKATVLTTQIYFDNDLKAKIYALSPYSDHAGWESNTQNDDDGIFDRSGMVTAKWKDTTTPTANSTLLGAINIGVDT